MRFRTLTALVALLGWQAASYAQQGPWVSAYYSGWWQGSQLNPDEIDYSAVTHILHFALVVKPDGTVAGEGNGITPANALSAVRAAHQAGKKILISVGGASSDAGFAGSTADANRAKFIAGLVSFMNRYGYDGIDVDWEPIKSSVHYLEFIRELRSAMNAQRPGSLLTTAVMIGTDRVLLAAAERFFDQINIMTYDMSGPWPNWVTWHNTALYDGGAVFPGTNKLLPSVDREVRDKLAAGIPASKLGIGIDFYGYRWWGGTGTSTGGVSRPRQSWQAYPNVKDNIPMFQLLDMYARFPLQWDSVAQASYISIDDEGSSDDQFISLVSDRAIDAAARYVRSMHLGGAIVYDLGGGYRRDLPPPFRDLLLQDVRFAFLGGKRPVHDTSPPSVVILTPKDGAVLSGETTLSTLVKDNSFVSSVEFSVDGIPAAPPATKEPYEATLNTWKYPNGKHTIDVKAYDGFGNAGTARHVVTIRNEGTMPALPDKVVFDDALRPPFVNTSWGATVRPGNRAIVMSGTSSVEIDYMAWGAFDILSGTWGAEQPIDPTEWDTLKADIYPSSTMNIKVAFYNNYSMDLSLRGGRWNSVAVPLAFMKPFTRFYFQSNEGKPARCYFDNIRFTAKTYRVTATNQQ